MVRLCHIGSHGDEFMLNPDLIVTIERKPDTIVHLISGHEVYVKETPEEIVERILEWRAEIIRRGSVPADDVRAEEVTG